VWVATSMRLDLETDRETLDATIARLASYLLARRRLGLLAQGQVLRHGHQCVPIASEALANDFWFANIRERMLAT
jgi:hypothetical protein